ncbi:MAG: hypothetical protein GQ533_05535 [Methanosarcinaceae archaeon]|nr:hypothetical protein [Methanosarcinaceae archaeon]
MNKIIRIFSLDLEYLRLKYKEWEKTHYESLNLFEIIQFGRLEPIHTKFLYWLLRPAYHNRSYHNKYISEFLKLNDIQINGNEKFIVHSEKSSNSSILGNESKRRVDLWIEIELKDSTKTIVIENKIDDDLTESQVSQEIRQYLKPENEDIFIALLLDSKKDQFIDLKTNSNLVRDFIDQGIKFKLFTFSNWLNLNKTFKYFNKEELDKVKHLNDNIKKVIEMKELIDFNEEFKQYLKSYSAIKHFEENFQKESVSFLNNLYERLIKIYDCEDKKIDKKRDNITLRFKIKNYGFEIWFRAYQLNDFYTWITVTNINKSENNETLMKQIQNVEGFDPDDTDRGLCWVEVQINPFDCQETDKIIFEKLQEINGLL